MPQELDITNLERVLTLLSEFLAAEGADPAWLLVCGGSALLATGLVARPTRDMDVMGQRGPDGEVSSVYPLPADLLDGARRVAAQFDFYPDWLNGSATLFVNPHELPRTFWSELDTREYGTHMKVSYVGRAGQILLKLYAACDREATRDFTDLHALAPDAGESEAAARWLVENDKLSPDKVVKLKAVLASLDHATIADKI